MISTTVLASDLKVGDRLTRKSRVAVKHFLPSGKVAVKTTVKGASSPSVATFEPDEYVRVYVSAESH